jgi:RimJ/RimL family protein N-acetyltransferase
MTPAQVRLRPAGAGDSDVLFGWVNLPEVRAASFDSAPVPRATHEAWFARKLADAACRIWIALDDEARPAGVIRFEVTGGEAVVSITVAPSHRGRGLAAALIEAGCRDAAALPGVAVFVAEIKTGHEPSRRAFLRAGFAQAGTLQKGGVTAWRMERPVLQETMQ